MRAFRKKHPAAFLCLACYALGLLVVLLVHVGQFVYNRVLHANGTLAQETLPADALVATNDLWPLGEGMYVTTGPDPQFWLADEALRADSVEIHISYTDMPLLVSAFWAAPGEGHSIRRMAYGQATATGYRFLLPAGGGATLRIDPDTVAGNIVTVEGVTLNPPRGLLGFLRPTAGEWLVLAVLPGLAACGLWALRAVSKLRKKGVARRG